MKTSAEMVSSLLERRDAYVTRQKQKRRTAMKIASATCAFALVALGAFGVAKSGWLTPDTPPVDDPAVTAPTDITNNPDGMGGQDLGCSIHNENYHAISGNFDKDKVAEYVAFCLSKDERTDGCNDPCNIVEFIQMSGVTREEYIDAVGWTEDDLNERVDYISNTRKAPYTKQQWLDAIFGSDPKLSEWVFADESTWVEN
ncbi:MAG: hypothetical protein IIX28_00015 [Clostridia bacterium]|nr:hypothetical protein [Clostridia bacterium]